MKKIILMVVICSHFMNSASLYAEPIQPTEADLALQEEILQQIHKINELISSDIWDDDEFLTSSENVFNVTCADKNDCDYVWSDFWSLALSCFGGAGGALGLANVDFSKHLDGAVVTALKHHFPNAKIDQTVIKIFKGNDVVRKVATILGYQGNSAKFYQFMNRLNNTFKFKPYMSLQTIAAFASGGCVLGMGKTAYYLYDSKARCRAKIEEEEKQIRIQQQYLNSILGLQNQNQSLLDKLDKCERRKEYFENYFEFLDDIQKRCQSQSQIKMN